MIEYTLGEFILAQMHQRDMSAREFARFVGVSHQTISRFLDYGEKDVGYPSVDFLFKLAEATDTDIGVLMRMLKPDYDEFDPQLMVIAQGLADLTPQERTVIETFINTMRKTRSGQEQ
jgi:transcriptional regulator with XRE-family HTH domain